MQAKLDPARLRRAVQRKLREETTRRADWDDVARVMHETSFDPQANRAESLTEP